MSTETTPTPRFQVHKLGPNYWCVWDRQTDLDVATRTTRQAAEAVADDRNRLAANQWQATATTRELLDHINQLAESIEAQAQAVKDEWRANPEHMQFLAKEIHRTTRRLAELTEAEDKPRRPSGSATAPLIFHHIEKYDGIKNDLMVMSGGDRGFLEITTRPDLPPDGYHVYFKAQTRIRLDVDGLRALSAQLAEIADAAQEGAR